MREVLERDKNLKLIINCYMEYLGERLVSIVLYGSRARGESGEESDYDLLIIAESLPESRMERMMFIRKPIVGKIDQRVSIIAKTVQEFLSSFPSIYLDMAQDGIILYDKGFIEEMFKRIKEIVDQAGLIRRMGGEDFYWYWEPPQEGMGDYLGGIS